MCPRTRVSGRSPTARRPPALPFLGGQITAEELQRGEIRTCWVSPGGYREMVGRGRIPRTVRTATRRRTLRTGFPKGLRFRLDPAIDVDASRCTRSAGMIAKAAQKYGFVVWDKPGPLRSGTESQVLHQARTGRSVSRLCSRARPVYAILKRAPVGADCAIPCPIGLRQTVSRANREQASRCAGQSSWQASRGRQTRGQTDAQE